MNSSGLAQGLGICALALLSSCTSSATTRSNSVTGFTSAPDGVSIAYEAHGSGPVALVFVHGWSCDRTYWREQIEPFAARYRVVAVDLAGHGGSGLDRTAWSMGAMGEDVVAVVKALDLERVVLVGHSMGGPVVVETARRLPSRTAGVVVVDSLRAINARMTPEELENFLEPLRKDFAKTTESWVRRVMFVPTSERSFIDGIATDMASAPPEAALGALKALKVWHASEALGSLNVPIRALNAKARKTDMAALREHGVEVVLVPGVGHFVMMEDPGAFNRLLDEAVAEFTQRS